MNGPHSVSWKMKVKASSGFVEPIQANLLERRSISRLEMIGESFPETAVDAVGQHHEIGVGKAADFIDLGFEHQMNAKFARPLLQDHEQHAPRAAAKAVAADAMHRAAEMHGDVVPVSEFLGDAAIARGIVFLEIVQGGVGKHHAEAKSVVGAVALIDRDVGLRPLLLEQDRRIQAGRSAADDRDLHGRLRRKATSNENTLSLKQFFRKSRFI